MSSNPSKDWQNEPWYVGRINRSAVECFMATRAAKIGDFVVRDSESVQDAWTLSCKTGVSTVRNDRIFCTDYDTYRIQNEPPSVEYESMQSLLTNKNFMAKRPVGVLILAMTGDNRTSSTPIPKIPPPRPQPPQNKFFLLLPPESIRRRSLPKGVRISREKSLIKKSISNGKLKRGGAMKHPNTIEVNGHLFVPRAFVTPTYCSHCRQFLFGLSAKTGVRCTECNMVAHTKCFEYVNFTCPGREDLDATRGNETAKKAHVFKPHTYMAPVFCDQCGGMLYGIYKQGQQCTACKINVHKACCSDVPDLCGTDTSEKRGRLRLDLVVRKNPENPSKYDIHVHVGEGVNLIPLDVNGYSDPYVKMYINPDPTKATKQKGEIFKNNLNPIFDECFKWTVNQADFAAAKNKKLDVEVWDWDFASPNEFMGSMSFPLTFLLEYAFEQPLHGWYKLLDRKQGATYHVLLAAGPGGNPKNKVEDNTWAECDDREGTGTISTRRKTSPSLFRKNNKKTVTSPRRSIEDFKLLKLIGKGSFGKVFLGEEKCSGRLFAIKALRKSNLILNDDVGDVITERRILGLSARYGRCPFITKLHMTCQSDTRLFFVMEFVSGGDLMFHITAAGCWSEGTTAYYIAETVEALLFLHLHGIIYRDLKLDNTLLTGQGHIKLTDFGLAKENMFGDKTTSTFCGTPDYIAPEILKRLPYNRMVDFWALGVMAYELLTGEAPFNGVDDDDLYHSILHQDVALPKYEIYRDGTRQFIAELLQRDPTSRLGSHRSAQRDFEQHPFFEAIDWAALRGGTLPPPIVPQPQDLRSCVNFDKDFTSQTPRFSVDGLDTNLIDQDQFKDFDYVCADGPGADM